MINLSTLGKVPDTNSLKKYESSPQFKGNRFRNPYPVRLEVSPTKIMGSYWQSDSKDRQPPIDIPIHRLSPNDFEEKSQSLRINWFGHATMMIEIDGLRMITDPVFSERVSPLDWAGTKRFHPTPISLQALPEIDCVLLSHNHYDHLDFATISFLKNRDIHYFLPLGLGATLEYWGIRKEFIHEMDWHDVTTFKGITLIPAQARHLTRRGLTDGNKTLWCSWIIRGQKESVFFGGDSGYSPSFEAIGERYGSFDLSMIGIGAYNKMWQHVHTNPEEAIKAHMEVKAKKIFPFHWGTFDLALHSWAEPIEWFVKEGKEKKIDMVIGQIGQWLTIDNYTWDGQEWWS